jgi:hypothetical protein
VCWLDRQIAFKASRTCLQNIEPAVTLVRSRMRVYVVTRRVGSRSSLGEEPWNFHREYDWRHACTKTGDRIGIIDLGSLALQEYKDSCGFGLTTQNMLCPFLGWQVFRVPLLPHRGVN